MTTHATATPPRSAARRYSQQIHTLVDAQTRAYILGCAALESEAGGYEQIREGEQVRELLDEAIGRRFKSDAKQYEQAVLRGREVLEERAEAARRRREDTSERVAAVTDARA